ncbi:MAG: hypothetical protein ACRDRW_10900 [Pseudonocardiaceae bacterium]
MITLTGSLTGFRVVVGDRQGSGVTGDHEDSAGRLATCGPR